VSDRDPHDPPPVEVGRVVKPHGLRGEVAVELRTDRPEVRFAAGATVWLDGTRATVTDARPHQGRWLVRFDAAPDRDAAEALRGRLVTAPVLEGDADADAYWNHELVGLVVVDEAGTDLGDVVAIVELPRAAGYDLLEVRRADGTSWYLPDVDELCEVVETEDGDLLLQVIDPPPGLLDPDAAAVVRPDDPAPDAGADDASTSEDLSEDLSVDPSVDPSDDLPDDRDG